MFEHLEQVNGKRHEMLEVGEYPSFLGYLLEWFYDLSRTRRISQAGLMAISYHDIMAFKTLMGIDIRPWEVSAIRRIDDAYLSVTLEWQEKKAKK